MSVARVWGRIQGKDAVLDNQEGGVWTFDVPSWASGPIIAEFWAEDDFGNVSYRSAVLEIEAGTIKCLRWLDTDGICIMEAVPRPASELEDVRPLVEMIPHICPQMEA